MIFGKIIKFCIDSKFLNTFDIIKLDFIDRGKDEGTLTSIIIKYYFWFESIFAICRNLIDYRFKKGTKAQHGTF